MTDVITTPGVRLSDAAIRRRMIADFWFYFRQNRGAVIGLAVFILLVLIAVFAPLIAPHDPTQQYRDALLVPPVWQEGGRAGFFFGTDAVGRDMLSRLIYGAQYSLFIGVVVVSIALVGGIVIGLVAGFFGGWVDTVIMRVMDVILAFPSLLLALVLVAVLGPGLTNAMIAIAIVYQPHFARLTRAAVMSELRREYVTAARVVNMRQFTADVQDHPAELPCAADRSGNALLLVCGSRCRSPRLPRHGCTAARFRMGHDAGGSA